MAKKKKTFIFTDIDLDGGMSYLLFKWFRGYDVPHISCNVTSFNNTFKGWIKRVNPDTYDQIYILDLDISKDSAELVDRDNVVIIDHHDTHVANKGKYKRAKPFIKHKTSCCKLIYELLHKKSVCKLTDDQKLLMLMADDYDCYNLQIPGSHELNTLYWNYQGNRVDKFANDFNKGFNKFTDDQQKIIAFYKKKVQAVIRDTEVYEATIPIKGIPTRFVSAFASAHINDVAHHIINNNNADVGIVTNLKSNKVSFRKSRTSDIDLSKLAMNLANGGGHTSASGGTLTKTFMTFSRLFQPIK